MRKRLFRLPWRTSADIERDLDEELSFHLEQRANALRRGGLSAEEAWREAQRQFGDMADARAYCHALAVAQEKSGRRSFLVEAFVQDLTYAVRQIRRPDYRGEG